MTNIPISISGVVEGPLDEAVLRQLVNEAGLCLETVHVKNGKDRIRLNLRGYNNAARLAPWLVLVDLDQEECAAGLRNLWLPEPSPWMHFRVAIRAVEAWLLADRERLAEFLSIAPSRIPPFPEGELTPKRTLVELARHSRDVGLRKDLVPRPKSGRLVGPAYSSRMTEYVERRWNPEAAAQNSDSLRRCRRRLRELSELPPSG
jgi:hypothetical protein